MTEPPSSSAQNKPPLLPQRQMPTSLTSCVRSGNLRQASSAPSGYFGASQCRERAGASESPRAYALPHRPRSNDMLHRAPVRPRTDGPARVAAAPRAAARIGGAGPSGSLHIFITVPAGKPRPELGPEAALRRREGGSCGGVQVASGAPPPSLLPLRAPGPKRRVATSWPVT